MGGREKRNEDKDGIMTRVKACEEGTPDRSLSIFAGFSNPLGMKFESCDWCPAPPSNNGFFAALVFGGELTNGFCLKLQLDLFIERIDCTGDFRSKYKCSSCPSLLRFVEARGLEKPAKIDDDRSGVPSSQALTRVMIPSLSSFLFSLPPTH